MRATASAYEIEIHMHESIWLKLSMVQVLFHIVLILVFTVVLRYYRSFRLLLFLAMLVTALLGFMSLARSGGGCVEHFLDTANTLSTTFSEQ